LRFEQPARRHRRRGPRPTSPRRPRRTLAASLPAPRRRRLGRGARRRRRGPPRALAPSGSGWFGHEVDQLLDGTDERWLEVGPGVDLAEQVLPEATRFGVDAQPGQGAGLPVLAV